MLDTAPALSVAFHGWSRGHHLKGASGAPLVLFHGGGRFDEFTMTPTKRKVAQHFGRSTWGIRELLGEDVWTWTGVPHSTKEAAEAALAAMVTVRPAYCTDDLHTAYGYASQGAPEDSEIKPLYVRMERPLDLRDPVAFREWVGDFSGEFRDPAWNMAHANYQLRSGGKVIQRAFDAGYDGVIFYDTDVMDRGLHTSYVLFTPYQAKAAPSEHGASYYGYHIRQEGNQTFGLGADLYR